MNPEQKYDPYDDYAQDMNSGIYTQGPTIAAPQLPNGNILEVRVLHKPRSAQGAWIPVEPNERIRLSGPRGKMLKIFIQIPKQYETFPPSFNIASCRLSLYEVAVGSSTWSVVQSQQCFEVLSTECTESSVIFAVRLVQQHIPLMFMAQLMSLDHSVEIVGYSVPFGTHNSGAAKVRNSDKAQQRSKDKGGESSSSPTSLSPRSPSSPEPNQTGWAAIQGDLYVDGVVRAQQFLQYSDLRLKTDISDISSALEIIQQLHGKSYRWKPNRPLRADGSSSSSEEEQNENEELRQEPGAQRAIGFIAQDVQRVLPELVKQDPISGYLSVSYAEMVPILVEAFKQFLKEFRDAQDELARLERARYTQLGDVLDALKDIHKSILQKHQERKRSDSSASSGSSSESSTTKVHLIVSSDDSGKSSAALIKRPNKKNSKSSRRDQVSVYISQNPQSTHLSHRLLLGIAAIILLVVLVSAGITLGVLFSNRMHDSSMKSVSWNTNNTVDDPGFEGQDPSDPTRAASWTGEYTLAKYSSLQDVPPSLLSAPFDKGEFGVHLFRASVLEATNFSDCSQTIDVAALLEPRLKEFAPGTVVFGHLTLQFWTFVAPVNASANSAAPSSQYFSASVSLFDKSSSIPFWFSQVKRQAAESPSQWISSELTVPLPVEASSISKASLTFASTLSGAEWLVFVDSAVLTFQFRTNIAAAPARTTEALILASPPISNPTMFVPVILSSDLSAPTSWILVSSPGAQISPFKEGFAVDSPLVNTTIYTSSALPCNLAPGRNYTVSFNASLHLTSGNQSEAAALLLNSSLLTVALRKSSEFEVTSFQAANSRIVQTMGTVVSFASLNVSQSVSWTLRLTDSQVIYGPVLSISFIVPRVSNTTTTFVRLAVTGVSIVAEQEPVPLRPGPGLIESETVTIPFQSSTVDQDPTLERQNCPHLQEDLRSFDPNMFADPLGTGRVSIPPNSKILSTSMSFASASYEEIYVPRGSELIFDDGPILLNVVQLRVDGALRIGSPTCRLFSSIRIVFGQPKAPGRNGLIAGPDATIEIFGAQFAPTWTRLSTTALPGTDRVYLQQAPNWRVGQSVVLGSSFPHILLDFHETATIRAIDGNVVQFTKPLRYHHWAGSNYQTEVALLSRQIVLSGDSESKITKIGGHFTADGPRVAVRIAGVEFDRMGHNNTYGRYPINLGFISRESGSYITDCSIHDSYYRGIVLRATSGVTLSRNVAYNTVGHAYALANGLEMNNTLTFNIALSVLAIGDTPTMYEQWGASYFPTADRIDPTDSAASGFWIANANNTFIGNAVSGAWTGYHLPYLYTAVAESSVDPNVPQGYKPGFQTWIVFDGNTAHTTGFPRYAAGVFVGSTLRLNNSVLRFAVGDADHRQWNWNEIKFTNVKVWLSSWGFSGFAPLFLSNIEVWDCAGGLSSKYGGASTGLIAHSNNLHLKLPTQDSTGTYRSPRGIEILESYGASVYYNFTFRNFRTENYTAPDFNRPFCIASRAAPRSQIVSIGAFNFENVSYSARFVVPTQADRITHSMHDFDGSLQSYPANTTTPAVVGSYSPHWNAFPDCYFNAPFNAWVCPSTPQRQLTKIAIWNDIDPSQAANATMCNAGRAVGPVFGNDPVGRMQFMSGECLYAWFPASAYPARFSVEFFQLNASATSVVAFSLPTSYQSVNVTFSNPYFAPLFAQVIRVNSLFELVARNSSALPRFRYYTDATHIYIQIRDWLNIFAPYSPYGPFPAPQLATSSALQKISVNVGCSGSSTCPSPAIDVPGSMVPIFDAAV
eukprot:TRINITY_DN1906_c0_g1_i1.p1 TRINITY_DN1906_c0_g1~~TRINITY_DN1906_c0_g1_i1.p1  ORF type:complete len:1780 (+),score=203.21 TRINITY_DN1906_c0_g1_i1:139-5478(+)